MWLHCLINTKPAYVVPVVVAHLSSISFMSAPSRTGASSRPGKAQPPRRCAPPLLGKEGSSLWWHCLINAKSAYVVPAAAARLSAISFMSALSALDRLPGLERLNHPGAARHPSLGRRGVICGCIASSMLNLLMSFRPRLLVSHLFLSWRHFPHRLPGLERLNHPGAARHPSLGRRGVIWDLIVLIAHTTASHSSFILCMALMSIASAAAFVAMVFFVADILPSSTRRGAP